MSAKILISAIGFGAVLAGCASNPFGADPKTQRCGGPSCDVQVAVSCSTFAFCKAFVDSETVQVTRGNSPNITWQISTPGYTFASNGIVFTSGGDQFDNCHAEANGRRFMCHNKHTRAGLNKYTINLSGSPAVPPLDPWVLND